MEENKCPSCGAPSQPGESVCKYCGASLASIQPVTQQTISQSMPAQPVDMSAIDSNWPVRSKDAAAWLGILLGGVGAHKFYLGQTGLGILYLLFCWTGIPEVVGLIEGILYITASDYDFQIKNHVRLQ